MVTFYDNFYGLGKEIFHKIFEGCFLLSRIFEILCNLWPKNLWMTGLAKNLIFETILKENWNLKNSHFTFTYSQVHSDKTVTTAYSAIDIVSNLVFWSRKMNKLVLLRINNFCQQWQKALLFTWLTGSLSLVNSVNGLRPSYDENFSIFPQHATTHCVKRRLLRLVWTDLKEETDPFTHRALYNRRNFLLCVIPPF